jgi:ribosomal protein S18 acetylase RimI-like enzyme
MAKKEVVIRKASPQDLGRILALYKDFMFDSFLINFGDSFVKEYLVKITESVDCVSLVAAEEDLTGFIIATFNSRKLFSELLLDAKLLCAWLKGIFICPRLALKSLGLLKYFLNNEVKYAYAEFLFIAVDPACRKRKIGTRLITEVLNLMRRQGIKRVKVSAVVKNEGVHRLLKKLGFQLSREINLFDKPMRVYCYDIF